MKRFTPIFGFILIIVALLLSSSAISCQQNNPRNNNAQRSSSPNGIIKFKKFSLVDSRGFGMEIFNCLQPEKWKFEGGVTWEMKNNLMLPVVAYKLWSENREAVLAGYPEQNFRYINNPYMNNGGYENYMPPENIEQLINEYYIPNYLSEATEYNIVDIVYNEAMSKSVIEKNYMLLNKIVLPILGTPRPQMQFMLYNILIDYKTGNKSMSAIVVIGQSLVLTPGTVMIKDYTIAVSDMKVPFEKKKYYSDILNVINNSSKPNLQYEIALTRYMALSAKKAISNAKQFISSNSSMISKTFDEMREMNDRTTQYVNQVDDRIWNNWNQTFAGNSTFVDPSNNQSYSVPSSYNAYRNGDGSIILSNEQLINPAEYLQGDYQELRREE